VKAHLNLLLNPSNWGNVALAFVTLMLRNIADAAELEVREEISQKCEMLIAVGYDCRQNTISLKVSATWHQDNSQGSGAIKMTCNRNVETQ